MKNNISKNQEFTIKQVNPKFRLFLFITINWLMTIMLVAVPLGTTLSILAFVDDNSIAGLVGAIIIISLCVIISSIYYSTIANGIEYLPKNLTSFYVRQNHHQIQKNKDLEVESVTNLFKVVPICEEVYEEIDLEDRNEAEFSYLSWIESSNNRLVVNGKINHYDFSWGIITKMKKTNFKIFLKAILYFGPIIGIVFGFFPGLFVNSICDKNRRSNWISWRVYFYRKIGGVDLFPTNVGKPNSENYLIFAAKLQNPIPTVTLIPKNSDVSHTSEIKNQYVWSSRISDQQKKELQDILKTLDFLPSIYVYRNNISIMMKKYHYNKTDDAQLQTWELLKQEDSDSDVQFKYLENAIKIYNIFNQKEL